VQRFDIVRFVLIVTIWTGKRLLRILHSQDWWRNVREVACPYRMNLGQASRTRQYKITKVREFFAKGNKKNQRGLTVHSEPLQTTRDTDEQNNHIENWPFILIRHSPVRLTLLLLLSGCNGVQQWRNVDATQRMRQAMAKWA
jgi:hypothetical protein